MQDYMFIMQRFGNDLKKIKTRMKYFVLVIFSFNFKLVHWNCWDQMWLFILMSQEHDFTFNN